MIQNKSKNTGFVSLPFKKIYIYIFIYIYVYTVTHKSEYTVTFKQNILDNFSRVNETWIYFRVVNVQLVYKYKCTVL